jgi:molecular chaperone GrpE
MEDSLKPENGQESATPGAGVPEGNAPETRGQDELGEARRTAETLRDQLLRKAAEFENYKRRIEGDFTNLIRNANESLILSLLPILDDLGRSLKAGKEGKDYEGLFKGVELIHAKFLKTLEGQGLSAFESVGQPFDVDFHDALLQVPREDVPPRTVVEEVERGYRLHDRVLRHAKVIVSTEPPPPEQANGEA